MRRFEVLCPMSDVEGHGSPGVRDEGRKVAGTGYGPQRLIIDERVVDAPLTQGILERWDGPPPEIVRDVGEVVDAARCSRNPLSRGKRTLLVTKRKGAFLTPCQGMTERHRACCGYMILNVAENCPIDCTYCILQAYLSNPLVVVYANLDGLRDEIVRAAGQVARGRMLRVGTGELADSLALDRLTRLSLAVVRAVEGLDNVMVELKTKTVEIENLLSVTAPPNVVVSWSLNTPRHIVNEEIGAPDLGERLAAARRLQDHGYLLAFHFDPLIAGDSWQVEYREVVEALFDSIDPARIVYISLGGLRYPPSMKETVEERFAHSLLTTGELVRSWDGKMRYFRPVRATMYRKMVEWISARWSDPTIYLCMESPQLWRDVFGWAPEGVEDVAERLDAGCRKAKLARSAMRAGH